MKPIQLFDPESSTFTYILVDVLSNEALIIDPVDSQLARDLAVIEAHNLRLTWVIETHAHVDHITSSAKLIEHTGARAATPIGCGIRAAARQLNDGDVISFGHEKIIALHTAGHTAGSMSFLWREHIFTGDTLLIDGCGRADFQSGSADALYSSITEILFALPAETTVWPAHDYKGRTSTTIGAEKAHNSRVAGKTRAEFVGLMSVLQLPKPKRIDEALPANLWLGMRHDADSMADGIVHAAQGYAGDITPITAHDWWRHGEAVLVDIRTDAERVWVGFVPGAVVAAWKQWPDMTVSADFDARLNTIASQYAGKPMLMLCRSGIRSIASAQRASELGYTAYNILEGFEGDPDDNAKRSTRGGWKLAGLPWRQN